MKATLPSRMPTPKPKDGRFDGENTPVRMSGNHIVDDLNIVGIKDIRKEALRLSLLRESLPVVCGNARTVAHADFEKQMTRLGLAIGREADRRAKVRVGYIKALSKEILRIKESHHNSIERQLVYISRFSKIVATRINKMTERSQEQPLNSTENKEYASLKRRSKGYARHYYFLRLREKEVIARQEFLYQLLELEKGKLVKAYRSVLADIRPIGGSFPMTKFSDEESVEIMNQTVGKYFPSDWIQASNDFSPLVVKKQKENVNAGSYYAANNLYREDDSPVAATSDRTELGDPESIAMLYSVLHHSDPEITLDSVPFVCEGGIHQVILHYDKEFFDPDMHEVNPDGTPAGEGWSFNDYPWDSVKEDEDDEYPFEDILPMNQWFRKMLFHGENFDTIAIEDFQEDHTYHEFAHRAEHTVKNGCLTFQEQAFLHRRSHNIYGKRIAPLMMIDDAGNVSEPFFNLDTTFSELNSNVLREVDEKATDDVFQHPVMEYGDFITPYIGRIYPSGGGREVLSMGAEIIFSGTYGAMRGYDPDYTEVDLDYRGFVLGAFAVL